jgi:hypothetical protein
MMANSLLVAPLLFRLRQRSTCGDDAVFGKDPGGDEVLVPITGRQDRLLGARIAGLTDAFQ